MPLNQITILHRRVWPTFVILYQRSQYKQQFFRHFHLVYKELFLHLNRAAPAIWLFGTTTWKRSGTGENCTNINSVVCKKFSRRVQ